MLRRECVVEVEVVAVLVVCGGLIMHKRTFPDYFAGSFLPLRKDPFVEASMM